MNATTGSHSKSGSGIHHWLRNATRRRVRAFLPLVLVGALATLIAGCGSSPLRPSATSTTASTKAPAVVLPTTPVGRQARWLMDALPHTPVPEAEIRAHFSALFLAELSPAKLNEFLREVKDVQVVSVKTNEPRSLGMIVSADGEELQVSLGVDTEGLIDGLLIGPSTSAVTYEPPPVRHPGRCSARREVTVGRGTRVGSPGDRSLSPRAEAPSRR